MEKTLNSGNLTRFDWNNETLELHFNDGSIINYLNVPLVVAAGLSTAKSAGSFIHQFVRGQYKYVKIKDSDISEQLKHLRHHKDTTVGLWATDRPDLIPEELKYLFFEIKE